MRLTCAPGRPVAAREDRAAVYAGGRETGVATISVTTGIPYAHQRSGPGGPARATGGHRQDPFRCRRRLRALAADRPRQAGHRLPRRRQQHPLLHALHRDPVAGRTEGGGDRQRGIGNRGQGTGDARNRRRAECLAAARVRRVRSEAMAAPVPNPPPPPPPTTAPANPTPSAGPCIWDAWPLSCRLPQLSAPGRHGQLSDRQVRLAETRSEPTAGAVDRGSDRRPGRAAAHARACRTAGPGVGFGIAGWRHSFSRRGPAGRGGRRRPAADGPVDGRGHPGPAVERVSCDRQRATSACRAWCTPSTIWAPPAACCWAIRRGSRAPAA